MVRNVVHYSGFYIGRYEVAKGDSGLLVSKRVTEGESVQGWLQFFSQDAIIVCQCLYVRNGSVRNLSLGN